MPKTFIAQSVQSVNPLHFVETGGVVTGLICNAEVNYGELGMIHQIDLWGDLTAAQKTQAQAVYNFLKAKITQIILEKSEVK